MMMTSYKPVPQHEPDAFDVVGMLLHMRDAVLRHKFTFALVVLLTMGATALYLKVWPPVYKAEALIMVERSDDAARDEFYVNWNVFRKEDARTEIELMRAGPVLAELIRSEGLTYDDVWHPPLTQLKHFWEESWVGVRYQEAKRWVTGSEPMEHLTEEEKDFGKTLDDLAASITVVPVGESNVGQVRMKAPSPRVARTVNRLLEIYTEARVERHVAEAQHALDALDQELAGAERRLRAAEARRVDFHEKNDVMLGFRKEQIQLQQLTDLEARVVSMREQIAIAEARLERVDVRLAQEDELVSLSATQEPNAIRNAIRLRRAELEMQLAQARTRYLEDSPEVQDIKATLAEFDELIRGEPERVNTATTKGLNAIRQDLITQRDAIESQLRGLRAGFAVLAEAQEKLQNRLVRVPELQAELNEIERAEGLALETYQVLALKHAQAQASLRASDKVIPSLRVMGEARPPATRSWPTLKVVLPVAFALGIGLGVITTLAREHLSGRVRRADLRGVAARFPVVGELALPGRTPQLGLLAPDGGRLVEAKPTRSLDTSQT